MWKQILCRLLVLSLSFGLSANAWSNTAFERVGGVSLIGGQQSEFKNSNRENRLLIEVNMLSGVNKTGIHQVPDNTTLVDMIALAGGPQGNFDISEVHVKRKTKNGYATTKYDLEDIVSDADYVYPPLRDGDVVMIEKDTFQNTVQLVSIVGVALGIVLSAIFIERELSE